MSFLLFLLCVQETFTACSAPSIVTLFAQNNGGGTGGAVYFDIRVSSTFGLFVRQIDLNAAGSVGAAMTTEVYVRSGTRVGFEKSSVGWVLVSSTNNSIVAAVDTPSTVDVKDFYLPFGVSALAIRSINFSHKYT